MYYSGRRSLGLAAKKSLILICWFATLATLCELSAASSADLVAGVADGSGTTADESGSSSMQAFQSAGLIPQILARAPKDVLQVGCWKKGFHKRRHQNKIETIHGKKIFSIYFHSLALHELAPTWSNLILGNFLQITWT
jgi:hypothetical protein